MHAPTDNLSSRSAPVLVAEDDGPSGLFFKTALEQSFDCRVTLVTDGTEALEAATRQCFDVLLLDYHMPGGGAPTILSALRANPLAASHDAPAIATSAELEADRKRHLHQNGFTDALAKPVSTDTLTRRLDNYLPRRIDSAAPLLDDRAAEQTSGSHDAVQALRGLFINELKELVQQLNKLAEHPDQLSQRLHRLLASSGFCGTPSLANASRRLKSVMADSDHVPPNELEHFRDTLTRTLHALNASGR